MRAFKGEKLDTLTGYTSNKDIAILIRKDVKDYLKSKNLDIKVSVKSTAGSIDVKVTKFPTSFINQDYIVALTAAQLSNVYNSYTMCNTSKMTDEANQILKDLKKIHQAYNYDRSDAMTDYFDVNYYGQVEYDYCAVNSAINVRRQGET